MERKKQEQARKLRKKGWLVKEIAVKLRASKSSVSRWTQDISCFKKQALSSYEAASKINKEKGQERRLEWRKEGQLKAKEKDWIHIAGCMLYWGEGRKSRHTASLSNSDPNLLKFYLKFLESIGVSRQNVAIEIQAYPNKKRSVRQIEKYWISVLGLQTQNLRKTQVNKISKRSKLKRIRYLEYGTCKILIHSTRIVQHIYGALEEYANADLKICH